jgi:hypothetical protein
MLTRDGLPVSLSVLCSSVSRGCPGKVAQFEGRGKENNTPESSTDLIALRRSAIIIRRCYDITYALAGLEMNL